MRAHASIRSRMLLGALLPIVGIVGVAAVSLPIVNAVRVNGPNYEAIESLRRLNSDVAPPPGYVIDAYAATERVSIEVQRLGRGDSREADVARRDVAMNELSVAGAAFARAYESYATKALDPSLMPSRDELFKTGQEFFSIVNEQLLPAVQQGDVTEAVRIQDSELVPLFERHRLAAQELTEKTDTLAESIEVSTTARLRLMLELLFGGLVLVTGAALFFGVRPVNSLSRRIRSLTNQAEEVASLSLPQRVSEIELLRRGQQIDGLPAFEAAGDDELTVLAAALTSLQDTALSQAIGQAKLRHTVSESLINVGRRNQSLITRALEYISSLEQSERDPETLDKLFRLDHMTTRMRRQAESLLVLADADRHDGWAEAEDMGDVLRGALSEIESYRQVVLAEIEPAVVKGSAVDSLIHLVAELLENATQFSPPTAKVTVYGRNTDNGYHLAVIDHGLGMTPEEVAQANRKLVSDLDLTTESASVIGHHVVARIAKRFGILVRLSDNQPGAGVTANVLLPRELLSAAIANNPSRVTQPAQAPVEAPNRTKQAVRSAIQQPQPGWSETPAPVAPTRVAARQPTPQQPLVREASPAPTVRPGMHAATAPPPAPPPASPGRVRPAERRAAASAPTPAMAPAMAQSMAPSATMASTPPPSTPLPPTPPPPADASFQRRVPGAQLPDSAGPRNTQAIERSPEEIRSQLSDFHSGWLNGQS